MNKPFFSIVLPTFNRAQYLSFAIQSILEQTFGDFELIVSNNNSSDETEEVTLSFDDPRICYFSRSETLPSLEHWEFALSKARGEFITFLGDDDANSIVTFELVKELLGEEPDCRLLGWQLCHYYWDDQIEPEGKISKDTLACAPFNGQFTKRKARDTIEDIFAMHDLIVNKRKRIIHNSLPSLVNAVYHRSLISEANASKYFFHPRCLANDRYNAIACLNLVEDFFYLDYPLHLHGFSGKSGTATFDSARNSFRNSSEELLTQVNCLTHRNYSANALLHAKADLGANLDYIEIDWLRFFIETYNDLVELKKKGFSIGEDLENFLEVLAEQTTEFQQQFHSQIQSKNRILFDGFVYYTKNKLRRSHQVLGLDKLTHSLRRKFNKRLYTYLNGRKTGDFSDILECAKMMDKKWLKKNQIQY